MTQAIRPTRFLNWVPNPDSNNLAEIPPSISNVGFQPGQPLVAQYLNQAFHTLDAWTAYLDEQSNASMMATTLNHSMRLLGGGTWRFDATTRALSWSQPVTFAIPSAPDSDNRLAAGSVMLPAGAVAYVQANVPFTTNADVTSGDNTVRNLGFEGGISVGMTVTGPGIPDGTTVTAQDGQTCTLSAAPTASGDNVSVTFASTGPLSVQVAQSATLVPGPTTLILARALDVVCSVGLGSTEMWLRDQEQRSLVSLGYVTTVQALAGAALTARQPVYLSPGVADQRTQGSAYPCEASAAQGPLRGQCIGLTHTATASGQMAHVVQSGLVGGFTGLVTGASYYLDPAVVGGLTTARTNTLGETLAPVGVAISSSMLLVHIGTPQQVRVTGTGFKTLVALGNSAVNSYGGGNVLLYRAVYDPTAKTSAQMESAFVMPFDGSLVSLTADGYTSASVGTFEVDILVNGNKVVVDNTSRNAGTFNYVRTFTKGQYKLAANDRVTVNYSTSQANISIYLTNVVLGVELPA